MTTCLAMRILLVTAYKASWSHTFSLTNSSSSTRAPKPQISQLIMHFPSTTILAALFGTSALHIAHAAPFKARDACPVVASGFLAATVNGELSEASKFTGLSDAYVHRRRQGFHAERER